mmetsp:Transcript_37056/g.90064  ORF Transcript_37056/g.90064 Transcript_37056/m.90064 type:complete len:223 (-) Transcript_37056:60-728(-)
MISKTAMDSQRLVCDMRKLYDKVTFCNNLIQPVIEKQNVTDSQLENLRNEYAESLASVSEQMNEMAAVSKRVSNDTCTLDGRMIALQHAVEMNESSQTLEERRKSEEAMNTKFDTLTCNVATLSRTMDDHIRTSEGKLEVIETDQENQDACLEVLKRCVKFQRESKEAPPVDNASHVPTAKKRPHTESKNNTAEDSIGMVGNLRNWTKSLLPRNKKMKGQDE